MSIISDISRNIPLVVTKLEEYEVLLEKAAQAFDMDGMKIEDLCKKHSNNIYFYTKKLNELKSLEDFFKMKVGEVESGSWKKFNEKYSRQLSTRDIQAYIAGEPEYVAMYELLLEVVNTRKQFESVVDGLKDMSWMLSHITKLRVAEIEDALL